MWTQSGSSKMVLHTHSRWKVVTNCYSKVLSNASEELLLDDKYQNIFTGFTEHISMKQNHPVIVCKSMSSDKCKPHPKTSLLPLPSAWKPTIYFLSYCFLLFWVFCKWDQSSWLLMSPSFL